MAKITFIEHSGEQHCVPAEDGQTLMQVAIDNAVPGIDADCGGGCACGTCHVIVAEQWREKLNPANDNEEAMLSMSPDPQQGSRLSCQVEVNEELDGLVVELPEFQM
ncbi:MAG: 2Fe-2S iron-sulfur cluster-binding protein [Cellvibrionaceae bacterium]